MRKIVVAITTMDWLDITKKCMDSIVKYTSRPYDLIVCDASKDNSTLDYFKNTFDDVYLYKLDRPYWIAKAWNLVLERTKEVFNPDSICLINNDITVSPQWLGHLNKTMELESKLPLPIGLVTPVTNSRYTFLGKKWTTSVDHKYTDRITPTIHGWGCCMYLPVNALNKLSNFDERFINNHDEIDYCQRVWENNMCHLHTGHADIQHRHGTVRNEASSSAEAMERKWRQVCLEYNVDYPEPTKLFNILWNEGRTKPVKRKHNEFKKWWDKNARTL